MSSSRFIVERLGGGFQTHDFGLVEAESSQVLFGIPLFKEWVLNSGLHEELGKWIFQKMEELEIEGVDQSAT